MVATLLRPAGQLTEPLPSAVGVREATDAACAKRRLPSRPGTWRAQSKTSSSSRLPRAPSSTFPSPTRSTKSKVSMRACCVARRLVVKQPCARTPSPQCLHDRGRSQSTRVDSRRLQQRAKFKHPNPLVPEVTRYHQVKETRGSGSNPSPSAI